MYNILIYYTKCILNISKFKVKEPIKNDNEVVTLMPGASGHEKNISNKSDISEAKKRKRTKSIGETEVCSTEGNF